jgi:hypothetical protein
MQEAELNKLLTPQEAAEYPFAYTQHEYMMMLLEQALENDRLSDNAQIILAKIISVTGWSGGLNHQKTSFRLRLYRTQNSKQHDSAGQIGINQHYNRYVGVRADDGSHPSYKRP